MRAHNPNADGRRVGASQHVALFLIRAYQLVLSPLLVGSCRFTPSCSHYAADSIRRFGFLRGSRLAVRRLMRCHPFGAHGFDPVPEFAPPELRRGKP